MKRTYVPITYFHGNRVNIPLVQLRSRTNGKTFWILNTHNPADVHGNAGKWRAESVRREIKRIHRLRSQGHTVLFTGDMNAKREFFCKATRSRHAALGLGRARPASGAATRAGTASTGSSGPATSGSQVACGHRPAFARASPTTPSWWPGHPAPLKS